MGSRDFGRGNGLCGGFERSIEGKCGRCTECKSDGSCSIRALVGMAEPEVIKIYQFPAKRTLFLASLYDFQASHDYKSR